MGWIGIWEAQRRGDSADQGGHRSPGGSEAESEFAGHIRLGWLVSGKAVGALQVKVGQKLRSQNGTAGREWQVVDPQGWSDLG